VGHKEFNLEEKKNVVYNDFEIGIYEGMVNEKTK